MANSFEIGDYFKKNPKRWIANDFDGWARGLGLGLVIEPLFELNDNQLDVRWSVCRCFELSEQLLPASIEEINAFKRIGE